MTNRIHNTWDDPRLPIEVRGILHARAMKVALAAELLIKIDINVAIIPLAVEIQGHRVINICLFVGGLLITTLAVEKETS